MPRRQGSAEGMSRFPIGCSKSFRLVGRLHELCLTEAGFFAPDPTPTNDDEIAWAAEREMAFLRRCADELADLAASYVRFSVALWVDLRPDWQE